jgi:hypothetical protein
MELNHIFSRFTSICIAVISKCVIMASHFDDTFFKILNLSFGRFARRIEVLRTGNLKLAWVMLAGS